jgi:hypothetical protein
VDFDSSSFLVSLLLGAVGFVSLSYGKKQGRLPQMAAGVALMVFPYFVSNVLLMLGIGVGLLALLGLAVWLGY